MIVCHCNSVNSTTIKKLLDEGLSLEQVIDRTGASSDCGSCFSTIKELFEELKNNEQGSIKIH